MNVTAAVVQTPCKKCRYLDIFERRCSVLVYPIRSAAGKTDKVFKTSGWTHSLIKVNSVLYMQNASQLTFIYLVVIAVCYTFLRYEKYFTWEIYYTYFGESV